MLTVLAGVLELAQKHIKKGLCQDIAENLAGTLEVQAIQAFLVK